MKPGHYSKIASSDHPAEERTGVVEAGVAAADGAVEGRLVRRDAGRDGRPAVRHVPVTRLGQGRRLSAACSQQAWLLHARRSKIQEVVQSRTVGMLQQMAKGAVISKHGTLGSLPSRGLTVRLHVVKHAITVDVGVQPRGRQVQLAYGTTCKSHTC